MQCSANLMSPGVRCKASAQNQCAPPTCIAQQSFGWPRLQKKFLLGQAAQEHTCSGKGCHRALLSFVPAWPASAGKSSCSASDPCTALVQSCLDVLQVRCLDLLRTYRTRIRMGICQLRWRWACPWIPSGPRCEDAKQSPRRGAVRFERHGQLRCDAAEAPQTGHDIIWMTHCPKHSPHQ